MKQFEVDARAIDAGTRVRTADDVEGSFKFSPKADGSSIFGNGDPFPPPKKFNATEACTNFSTDAYYNIKHKFESKWDEDALIWKIQTEGLKFQQKKAIAQILHVDDKHLNNRLSLLRSVFNNVRDTSLSLAEPKVAGLWHLYDSAVHDSHPTVDTNVDSKAVLRVACAISRTFPDTEKMVKKIRDLKHYLSFAGIHQDSEYPDPALQTLVHTADLDAHDTRSHSTSYSLIERQYIYDRRLRDDRAVTPYSEIAKVLGRTEQMVVSQRRELAAWVREAAVAMEEGVTLAPGPDTHLWDAYMQTLHCRTRGVMEVAMVTAMIRIVADNIHMSFVQAQLRLKLIRTLKRFLYIAGVHEEAGELQQKFERIAPAVVKTEEDDTVQHVRSQHDLRISNAVSAAVRDLILHVEQAEAASSLLVPVTEMESRNMAFDSGTPRSATPQSATDVSKPLRTEHQTNKVVHTPAYPSLHCTPLYCTSTHSAVGLHYSIEEDRVVWSAWQKLNPALHNNFAARRAMELAVAKQLNRTNRGVETRLSVLIKLATQVEQAVESGATLLPSDALTRYGQYSELLPLLNENSSHWNTVNSMQIDKKTVRVLMDSLGVQCADWADEMQAIKALKWYLQMSGVHNDCTCVSCTNSDTEDSRGTISASEGAESRIADTFAFARAMVKQIAVLAEHSCIARDSVRTLVGIVEGTVQTHTAGSHTFEDGPRQYQTIDIATLLMQKCPKYEITGRIFDAECSDGESSSQQQSSLSLLPLPSCVLPFAFKLQDEGEIWRAYLQHQHDPSVNLCARLTTLSKQLGCTFEQIRGHLTALMNLQLGLSSQHYSTSRAFTAAEDKLIWKALRNTNALLSVSQQMQSAVGAVAARHRQLKTLHLLETVRAEVHPPSDKKQEKSGNRRSKTVVGRLRDCTFEKRSAESSCVVSDDSVVAYFSTEGENSDDST